MAPDSQQIWGLEATIENITIILLTASNFSSYYLKLFVLFTML